LVDFVEVALAFGLVAVADGVGLPDAPGLELVVGDGEGFAGGLACSGPWMTGRK
jgi:hypothetical protein